MQLHAQPRQVDEILTKDDVAKYFKVSKVTIEAWVNTRGMPSHKMGESPKAAVRFSRNEIDEWFRNQCFATPTTTDDSLVAS